MTMTCSEPGLTSEHSSLAEPLKEIVSPTAHTVAAVGEPIVASGGVFPALIEIGSLMLVAPWLSVSRNRTMRSPSRRPQTTSSALQSLQWVEAG